nr:2-amino-4-hydroxy-6-hydroxymethyldihydropteridine diphosphokinase [Corynebacterium uropygiale]
MIEAVLSIGSNMADRQALLDGVIEHFAEAEQLRAASRTYATPPWGVTDQEDFLNATLLVEVPDEPLELLRRCQALENAAHRVRERRWGPRTLDVDIIQIRRDGHELLSEDPTLTLPHPWAHARAFVLIPWAEIEPEAQLRGQPIAELIAALPDDDVQAVTPP